MPYLHVCRIMLHYTHGQHGAAHNRRPEMTTAHEILEWNELSQGSAAKKDILAAHRAADEGGTIQAHDALRLFRYGDPRLHTCMSLRSALIAFGCESLTRK